MKIKDIIEIENRGIVIVTDQDYSIDYYNEFLKSNCDKNLKIFNSTNEIQCRIEGVEAILKDGNDLLGFIIDNNIEIKNSGFTDVKWNV